MTIRNNRRIYKVRQHGVSLVEVVVAIGIIAVLLVTVSLGLSQMVFNRSAVISNTVAVYLAEEGYEMVRTIRDQDWNDIDSLTVGDTYFIDATPSSIAVVTSPVVIDGVYTRSFVLDEVYRNSDDDIVPEGTVGATVDPNARLVVVSVSGGSANQIFTGLVTNLYTP